MNKVEALKRINEASDSADFTILVEEGMRCAKCGNEASRFTLCPLKMKEGETVFRYVCSKCIPKKVKVAMKTQKSKEYRERKQEERWEELMKKAVEV